MSTTAYGPRCPHSDEDFGTPVGDLGGALVLETATGYVSDTVLASARARARSARSHAP